MPNTREKLVELLNSSFEKQYEKRGLLTAPHTADDLIANGVTVPSRCGECKHWLHTGDGMGDCTNGRFHLDGHADPTMKADDFCSCGERRGGK